MNQEERQIELEMWLGEAKGAERVAVLQALALNELNKHLVVIADGILNTENTLRNLNSNIWTGLTNK